MFPVIDNQKMPKTEDNSVAVYYARAIKNNGRTTASSHTTEREAQEIAGRYAGRGWTQIEVVRSYVGGFVHMG